MIEEFKKIKGYEELYLISNRGNVFSIKSNRFLTGSINSNGYLMVGLYKNKVNKKTKIHQLVAIEFLNHNPDFHKLVIDHINGIKTDNRLENLRIISHRENTSLYYAANKYLLSSKYTGVSWSNVSHKWRAQIRMNGKQKHLGLFDNEIDAYNIYKEYLNIL